MGWRSDRWVGGERGGAVKGTACASSRVGKGRDAGLGDEMGMKAVAENSIFASLSMVCKVGRRIDASTENVCVRNKNGQSSLPSAGFQEYHLSWNQKDLYHRKANLLSSLILADHM